jgi:hypothetical protein
MDGPAEFLGIDNSRFSFSVAYDQYEDKIYSGSNFSEYKALFSIYLLSLDGLLFRPNAIDHPGVRF